MARFRYVQSRTTQLEQMRKSLDMTYPSPYIRAGCFEYIVCISE
jgi:hypothetical protein